VRSVMFMRINVRMEREMSIQPHSVSHKESKRSAWSLEFWVVQNGMAQHSLMCRFGIAVWWGVARNA
jgi:hypothetical protein